MCGCPQSILERDGSGEDHARHVRYRTEHAFYEADNCRHDKRPPEDRRAQQWEIDMNRDRFVGNWKQFGGKVKEQWGRLTNDPQREFAGRRDQRAGRIQERYGISKEEAARQLKDFRDRNRNWTFSNR